MLKKSVVLLLVLVLTLSLSSCGDKNKAEKKNQGINRGISQNVNKADFDDKQFVMEMCRNIYTRESEKLILVNKDNPLNEDYVPNLVSTKSGKIEMEAKTYDALVDMLDAGDAAGHVYLITSGYRDRNKQQWLVNVDVENYMAAGMSHDKALEKTYRQTMPPGYSEHQTGMALDILDSENLNLDDTQAKGKANIWLRENCYKYGFILRYPKDKEAITMIDFEPWHFRYVGKKAALIMYRNNLSLEEFIQYAKE